MTKNIFKTFIKHLIVFSVLMLGNKVTWSQITFSKTYGVDSDAESANSGQQTSDGGYILAGTSSGSSYNIVKTDSNGDTLWTKNSTGKTLFAVQEVPDGFIFAGGPKIYLLKTDLSGGTLWSKTFSTNIDPSADFGYSVQRTSDNGFIITGQKNYNSISFHGDICLIKTDSLGNQSWVKLLTTGLTDCAGRSVQQTSDGGYIVGGHSYNQLGPFSSFDLCLVKTDSAGFIQWSKYFGSPPILGQPERGYSVKQTTDGGYILAGTYSELLSEQAYFVKTDSAGDTLWTRRYGTSPQGFDFKSVWQTFDGGYIATGQSSTDLLVLKTDSNGDTLWTKIIDGSDFTGANYIQQTTDGGYAIMGTTAAPEFSNNLPNGYDHLLIKTDSTGNFPDPTISAVNNIIGNSPESLIFPNPSGNEVTIQLNSPQLFQFILYNSVEQKLFESSQHGKSIKINMTSFSGGIYFYKLVAGKSFIRSGKIIKL